MQLSHAHHKFSVRFDDPNLVSCAGLVPVAALAERAGLVPLLERLTVPAAHAATKVIAIVLGMVAGADSISDLDLLRHGAMRRVFDGVRAPSTLGTFLRSFGFGHVRQLDAVAARLLAGLVARTPVLPGRDQIIYLDVDDTVRETYGYAKQGAGRGYTGAKGLNVLLATLSSPGRPAGSVPVIAAARLREGAAASVRGAWKLVADALATARRAGASGLVIVRADSAYYAAAIVATARRAGARFSVTLRHTPAVIATIAGIDEAAWVPIRYREAVWDSDEGRWISEAEVAEIGFTAFTGRRRGEQVTARLIVRRVRRLDPDTAPPGHRAQGELFAAYRYHAIFTDSPMSMLDAEAAHRDHAIIEQVIADLKHSALAHLPSGNFQANGAWLACAVMAYNLTRAAGALAGCLHTRARSATLRAKLINVAARIAGSARRLVLHLPQHWPWEAGLDELFRRALHDPLPIRTT
jgi:hypothetical protein